MWSQSVLSAALLLVLPSPELASPNPVSTYPTDFEAELFLPCEAGVRVPHNFIEDTRPCPEGFRCRARNSRYMSTINKLKTRKTDLESIVKSYQRPRALCKRNPCPSGKWPWLDKDGFYRCLPASESVKECKAKIRKIDGKLHCKYLGTLSLLGYIPTWKCRRNQIYINGRCRFRFFG